MQPRFSVEWRWSGTSSWRQGGLGYGRGVSGLGGADHNLRSKVWNEEWGRERPALAACRLLRMLGSPYRDNIGRSGLGARYAFAV